MSSRLAMAETPMPDVHTNRLRYAAVRLGDVRQRTLALLTGLSDADATVQSMPDASPAKWHAAHTTWFFETFLLLPHASRYRAFDPTFAYLFNSYYEALGARHPRPARGLLTRPSLAQILAYRAHVDAALDALLASAAPPLQQTLIPLLELGIAHEEQHQELLLTDILHLFAQNPLRPAFRPGPEPDAKTATPADPGSVRFLTQADGLYSIGAATDGSSGFAFDNEGPAHGTLLHPHALAERCVTNSEFAAFIADGGYGEPRLWLADGFARVKAEGWTAPLYWEPAGGERGRGGDCADFIAMTLSGMRTPDPAAPVTHVSYYEADAFARWAGARLPGEAEWEVAAARLPATAARSSGAGGDANDLGSDALRPLPAAPGGDGLRQMFGDVWEWTETAYLPYPGFAPAAGAVGEYNGKFMSGQMVLRGGSCATPPGHVRATYRNFFYPHQRWQFTGIRLAVWR